MKPDSDFSFSEPPVETARSAEPSMQLPFALMTCAIAVLMIAQTVTSFKQRTTLREGHVQLEEAFKQREKVVAQSKEIQSKLQELVADLLILSKTDDDAKQIVGKYNIQQNAPAAEAPAK